MARPVMERVLGAAIPRRGFRPSGQASSRIEEIKLTFDEAEALRLADLEGLYQQAAAQRMGVSRQTFGRIVEAARRKTADAIINGKRLYIEGGNIVLGREGDERLVIAVTLAPQGMLETRFGKTRRFGLYWIAEDGGIERQEALEACIGQGCRSSSAPLLASRGVKVLITGCIGEGAFHAFAAHDIEVVRGASGLARDLAMAFGRGELDDDGRPCEGGCHGREGGCR